jgi:cell division septal protein FtsQ
MAWRKLGAGSDDAEENRVRRRRRVAWAIWLLIVLVGMAIVLAQNSAT